MVASKQVATSAIQGHFSSEGLCAMAQGVDPRIRLAQAAAEKSPEQVKGLKSMFDVLNQWHTGNGEKKEYKKMPTFNELTGIDLKKELEKSGLFITDSGESVDFFGMFGIGVSEEVAQEPETVAELRVIKETEIPAEDEKEADDKEEPVQGAGSLFGLFGEMDISSHFHKPKSKTNKSFNGMKQVINF